MGARRAAVLPPVAAVAAAARRDVGRDRPRRRRAAEDRGVGLRATRYWAHDRWTFPLPEGHRFPIRKYGLLRERVVAAGLGDVRESGPAAWEDLVLVHDAAYLERVRTGALGLREQRGLGLPWSPELVERGRRSSQGTVEAARDALRGGWGMNLGGGTHHAGPSSGRGFCLFNDAVLAARVLRAEGEIERALIIDCDVHQGDGTAELCADDPLTFALSVHAAANYPFHRATSDCDVDLPSGTGDDDYLAALETALHESFPVARPDLVIFLAGADPWEGDGLGRLALTKAGLRARDELVTGLTDAYGLPCCVTLAGGYAPDVGDTVAIALATAELVAHRARGTTLASAGP